MENIIKKTVVKGRGRPSKFLQNDLKIGGKKSKKQSCTVDMSWMNKFTPIPEIAKDKNHFDPKIHKTYYQNDYCLIRDAVAKGDVPKSIIRDLIIEDSFFFLFFIIKMRPKRINHWFVVDRCRVVDEGPKTYVLDIWARGHFKSTIGTVIKSIQKVLKDTSKAVAIFSHTRTAAKFHLRYIKSIFENSAILKEYFPDICWADPDKESPSWSEEFGLTIKREEFNPTPNFSAWSLNALPTGSHPTDLEFDDIETLNQVTTGDMIEQTKDNFDMSLLLSDFELNVMVRGTYYSHVGPLTALRDLENKNGTKAFQTRLCPATTDGGFDSPPVYVSQEKLDKLKLKPDTYYSQFLCNPTPPMQRRLNSELFVDIDANKIPPQVWKIMVIDPAGTIITSKTTTPDSWAIMVIGVDNTKSENSYDVYIMDMILQPLDANEAVAEAINMYRRNSIIQCLGIEEPLVGFGIGEHLSRYLRVKFSEERGNYMHLRHGGRNKVDRIINALSWPLYNGHIYISSRVLPVYKSKFKVEADTFPVGHDDGLDALSYGYQMIAALSFRLNLYRPQTYKVVGRSSISWDAVMGES